MTEIDLRGLRCPLPALKTQKRLAGLKAGSTLCVLADDPMAAIDIPHLCRVQGHRLAACERAATFLRFEIVAGDTELSMQDQPNE